MNSLKHVAVLLASGVSIVAFASAAHAADLVVEGPGPIQYAEPAHSWDGAYIGVFGGYGWGSTNFDTAPPGTELPEPAGWLLGVNAGANFTLTDGIVAGVVGDIAWADMSDSVTDIGTITSTIDWLGSVRGRVGFDGGAFMPYLTAGLAFAHNTVEVDFPANDSDDQTHVGWTVGAGVAIAATENLSIDLLYRYSDYGVATYTISGSDADMGLTGHTLSAGLNFGF